MWTDIVDGKNLAAAPASVAVVRELGQTAVLWDLVRGVDEVQVGPAALSDGRIGVEGGLPGGRMVLANCAKIK
jgi:hypothetical protein